jgi:hypothetical protein
MNMESIGEIQICTVNFDFKWTILKACANSKTLSFLKK